MRRAKHLRPIRRNGADAFVAQTDLLLLALRKNNGAEPPGKENPGSGWPTTEIHGRTLARNLLADKLEPEDFSRRLPAFGAAFFHKQQRDVAGLGLTAFLSE